MKKATVFLLVFLLASVLASAQTFEVGGSLLVNDDQAVDVSAARAFVAITGLDIPVPGDTYTGVIAEAGWSTATSVERIDNTSTGVRRGGLVWSLWSMNRTEIAHVIAGADVRIARGGPVMGSDFDVAVRIVGGYRVTENLGVYAFFLEDQTPFSFAVGWKF